MNPFFLSPDDQLAAWKELREGIQHLTDEEALKQVAEYWSKAPLVKMAYDPEDCSQWPSPWEMIHANDWCPYSIAIAMEFTLRLGGWDANRMILMMIRDYDISDQRMILKVDENTVLNYTVGIVEEYPTTRHDVLMTYQNDGKRYFLLTK